ncbi:MAG: LytTR family DNA-binding domain-containing protein [Bacteroidota bacterium]
MPGITFHIYSKKVRLYAALIGLWSYFFFGSICSFAQEGRAQEPGIDSIPFYTEETWSKEEYMKTLNTAIENALKIKDTATASLVFQMGNAFAINENFDRQNKDYLQFRISHTRFLLKYSKISIESALSHYHQIYKDAQSTDHHDIEAQILDYMATAYRSNGQMDKAFEFNQKEIRAAALSTDSLLVGRSLITELDIVYNSFPWPLPASDFDELIAKGDYVIAYGKKHQLNTIYLFGKLYVSKFYIEQGKFEEANELLMSISDDEALPITFSKYEHLCEIAKQTQDQENYRKYTLDFKERAYRTKRSFVALNANNYLLDYALLVQNKDSATFYMQRLEENLAVVDTTKYLDFLDVSYTTLAHYFKDVNPSKQLKYLSYSAQINKIIVDRQRKAYGAILRYKEEVASLETANTNLTKSNSNFKRNLIITMGFLLLLLILVIVLTKKYRRSKSRETKVIREKERLEEIVVKNYIEPNNKQRIFLDELKFIKADKNYVEFHTDAKRIIDRNKLSSVIAQLPPNFIQVHRSYVINKNFIKSSTGTHIVLIPEIEIPLSRTFKNKLNGGL